MTSCKIHALLLDSSPIATPPCDRGSHPSSLLFSILQAVSTDQAVSYLRWTVETKRFTLNLKVD